MSEMIGKLNLEPLNIRCTNRRLTIFHKAINGQLALPIGHLQPVLRRTRHLNSKAYNTIHTSKDCYKYSFFPRTIKYWNSLPDKLPTIKEPRQPLTPVTQAAPLRSECLLDSDAWQRGVDVNAKSAGNAQWLQLPTTREEATKPSYDLLTAVRTRRHQWLGHILRMSADRLVRRAVLALGLQTGPPYQPGSLLMDTPIPLTELVMRAAEDGHETANPSRDPPYRKTP